MHKGRLSLHEGSAPNFRPVTHKVAHLSPPPVAGWNSRIGKAICDASVRPAPIAACGVRFASWPVRPSLDTTLQPPLTGVRLASTWQMMCTTVDRSGMWLIFLHRLSKACLERFVVYPAGAAHGSSLKNIVCRVRSRPRNSTRGWGATFER